MHAIVSLFNPKQWLIILFRLNDKNEMNKNIGTVIKREMGLLKKITALYSAQYIVEAMDLNLTQNTRQNKHVHVRHPLR